MPVKNYMVVDPRRDHSFRIPRPDQSVKLGTPNPCTAACHANKTAQWAADSLRQRLGHDPQGHQNYAPTFHAARHHAADAEAQLLALLGDHTQPGIARATAAAELGQRLSPDALPGVAKALGDGDPQVRAAAVEALDPLPVEQRWQAAHTLLRDPLRVVRALAAGTLADMPKDQIPADAQASFQQANAEYLAAQRLNADEPGAQVNLGNFHAARGEGTQAEAAYRQALKLNPDWTPAYANLADLYRATGRDAEGETLLRASLAQQPKAAALHHSLGLLLVRQNKLSAALAPLRQAAALAPDNARFAYVYAVALDSAGRKREAHAAAEAGLKHSPGDATLKQLVEEWAGRR
jgi:Flp pilus assembly protein TadD